VGGQINRPPRGSLYVGFQSFDGPFHSEIISTSFSYQLSPKWISSYSTAIDFRDPTNVSQALNLTRIGESLLIRVGLVVNESKDVFGVNFMIEPRFLPKGSLAQSAGAQIAPAGAFGLE
jgi:hypothetical protein